MDLKEAISSLNKYGYTITFTAEDSDDNGDILVYGKQSYRLCDYTEVIEVAEKIINGEDEEA